MATYTIVVHGGAVTTQPGELSAEQEAQQRAGLAAALNAGWQVLHRGGAALDAVEAAVRSLEDNEHFNAGRGSSLTERGEVEMDAAIMDGRNLQAGAVSAVKYTKNPVSLARAVMEKSPHVCLAGEGALELALQHGLTLEAVHYFKTEKTQQEWLELMQQQSAAGSHDTVGAVALDQAGNLAAATSTGGLEGQRKGRVGDTPTLGGGTYASNDACAVSCTGDGEVIMRGALAHEVYALVKYQGLPAAEAARRAISLRPDDLPGDKGLIAIDHHGNVALEFNCNVMRRAYRIGEQALVVAIWKDE